MTGPSPPPPLRGPALRALQRELVAAQDERIARVLALVDDLAVRGDADKLIAPLRVRLADLRPRRKLSLSRLLALPLEPLIVEAVDWSVGAPSIPRTALSTMVRHVTEGLGPDAQPIATASALLARNDELERIVDAGAVLWRRAAGILAAAPVPPDWTAVSGLRPREHVTLAAAIAALLAQAPSLLGIAVRARAGDDPEPAELTGILAEVARAGPLPLTMLIAMGMNWLPRPELLLRAAAEFVAPLDDAALRASADRAVEFVLSGIEHAPLRSPDVAAATHDVRRIAIMLQDLKPWAERRPGYAGRLEAIRRGVDAACRERFAGELEARLLVPAVDMAAGGDEAISALESTARDLRRFETAARQIGGAEHYARHLQRAADLLRPAAGEDAVARIARIRLVEILRGPDAAMAML